MSTVGQIDLHTEMVRSSDLLYAEVGGDVSLMSVQTGKYYGLTSAGARIWSLLEQPMTAAAVGERLMAEYRVDRTRCMDDVMAFVRRMHDEGVLQVNAPVS